MTFQPGIVVHIYNSSTQESELEISGLHSKTLSQRLNKIKQK
jgi:hypothetical protein